MKGGRRRAIAVARGAGGVVAIALLAPGQSIYIYTHNPEYIYALANCVHKQDPGRPMLIWMGFRCRPMLKNGNIRQRESFVVVVKMEQMRE